jgi:D-alanyl-D-alanine carboxypeptidase (penicillin-binding protein 5/6)
VSELGDVTTLSSEAVGTATHDQSAAATPGLAEDRSKAPGATVPEAALVAVYGGAFTAVAPVAPATPRTGPAPEAPTAAAAIPLVEVAPDATAVDSTEGSGTVIVPVPGSGRRSRRLWPAAVIVAVAALGLAGVELARPVPKPVVRSDVTLSAPVPGIAPALPWPDVGEAAVAVPSLGLTIASAPERRVPIASLTKMMTAYITLRDHPLAPDAQGPVLVLSAADQQEAAFDAATGATSVPVVAGERLNERQILNGLLVHSANNLADTLARWDAGSVPAFVDKMNITAAALGMDDTHYADADGLNPASVGTARDELRIASVALDDPTFAAVVAQPTVTLPVAGLLSNYVDVVGHYGIVGVKSGFTQAAMGCMVVAAVRIVGGRPVIVLAAVTGQPGARPLDTAQMVDLRLVNAVGGGLQLLPVIARGTRVASVTAPWSSSPVPAVADSASSLVAWPGQSLRVRVSTVAPRAGAAAGTRIGTLTASVGPETVRVAVVSTRSIGTPSLSWRLRLP